MKNVSNRHNAILKVLKNGKNITVKELAKKSKVSGITQRIAELRQNGYPNIYTNTLKVDDKKVYFYRLGAPTKAMKKAARNGRLVLANNK